MCSGGTNYFGARSVDNNFLLNRASSSVGNQKKFQDENGMFYKEDLLGYEGLSEVLSSRLAKQTTLASYGITEYRPALVGENKRVGCCSTTFNPNGYQEVSLYEILISHFYTDLAGVHQIYEETSNTVNFTFFDFIRKLLYELYKYDILTWITQLLKFDWLVLNEDRHFRNIAFLLADGKLQPAPLFDNGAALLSDLTSCPLGEDINVCISQVAAKPFNSSFERQVRAIEEYGAQKLNFVTDVVELQITDLTAFYSEDEISRAKNVLMYQMHKLYPNVEVKFL